MTNPSFTIKAIFFDFDGVLTTEESGSVTNKRNLHKLTGISLEKIAKYYKTYWKEELIKGTITHQNFWDDFCACLEVSLPITRLSEIVGNVPQNRRMVQLAHNLRQNGYKIGIITDNDDFRFKVLEKEMKLPRCFDTIIVSARVGAVKTNRLIFEKALEALKVEPEESVFIDNRERNLAVPAKMGFKIYLHDYLKNDVKKLADQLREWGIKVKFCCFTCYTLSCAPLLTWCL